MTDLLRDLRLSIRRLLKNPGLTVVVLLTLALGIGANTAMFTVDYASMIAPIPYPNPDQLVVVWSKVQGHNNGISAGDFLDWRQRSSAFQSLDAVTFGAFNISTQDQPEFLSGAITSAGFFLHRGIKFQFGRDFIPEEEQPGKNHVVVLSHKLWKRLGSDPHILGKILRLDNIPYTVVGVWAAGIPEDRGDMWLDTPLTIKPEQMNHDFHWLLVLGRMKPGVTLQQAQADMDRVTAVMAQTYPADKGWGASVEQLKNDFFPKEQRMIFWLLLGAVGFVLLIACVNVANLLLAKGMSNQKDVAIRIALGATRKAIFAQQLIESLVLALAGGLLGIGVGYAMLQGTIALIPKGTFPDEADMRLNLPILLFTLAATTVCGLLFGSIPAWYASRVSPGETLKEGGRSGVGTGRHRLRRILVIGEFALALPLLAGAGLAIHSFWNLHRVDLGVRTDHVLTFGLQVPEARPKDADRIIAYYHQILDSIRSVPGIIHATAMTGMPLEGSYFGMPFSIAGKPAFTDPSQRPACGFQMVTPEYFQTFGVRLIKGREFTPADIAGGLKVAMVNEEFANKFLKGDDPLQQRVIVEQLIPGVEKLGPAVEWQIVGVFHNIKGFGFRRDNPEVVVPFWQSPWPSASIGVLTAGNPGEMIKSISAAVHSVDPDIALATPRTMEQIRSEVLQNDSFMAILFTSFAGIALLLAGVGIYGVMAFSVAQRSHEIAVRMALGSGRNRVVNLVVREGLVLAAIGLALGLIGAYFVGRSMQSILFDVHAMDFAAFSAVGVVLLFTGMIACVLPARRAASAQPMQALRTE